MSEIKNYYYYYIIITDCIQSAVLINKFKHTILLQYHVHLLYYHYVFFTIYPISDVTSCDESTCQQDEPSQM